MVWGLAVPRRRCHSDRLPFDKPFLVVFSGITRPGKVREWMEQNGIRVLNVAGNRESRSRGMGERFLGEVFRERGERK